jgi:hypothetical protein
MAAYTGTIEAIYSAATNGTVAKNCDKDNKGAFHAKLELSCQLVEQPMQIYWYRNEVLNCFAVSEE